MKKFLFSLMAILLAVGVVGAGAFALFSDVEKVEVGDISAGTLDLTVNDANPCTEHITLHDMKPGDSVCYEWVLKNTGTITGKCSIEFSQIINNDNGLTEPEQAAGDTSGGPTGGGELGAHLKYTVKYGGTTLILGTSILNSLGGQTLRPEPGLLAPGMGETVKVCLELLPEAGNIVQSDSVAFDIIFHLNQAP